MAASLPRTNRNRLAWVILFFAALNVIFLGGKRRAFGTFIAQFHEEFRNISLTELNWIGDSYAAVGHMSTTFTVAMILHFNRRYGLFQFIGSLLVLASCISSAMVPNPHWLFLTITLLHGVGSSLVISTVGLVVNEYFDKQHKYHIMATTLVSGGSMAAILFVSLFAILIEQYNWRNAFLILGVLYFGVIVAAALTFRKNVDLNKISGSQSINCSCHNISRVQVPLLLLWFIDRVVTSVVTYGILLNLTDYVHRHEHNLLRSTILTTLFASGEGSTYLIGAIITGVTKTFFQNKLRYILLVSSVIMSASLITLEFTADIMIARRVLCFVAGFSLGPSNTFNFPGGEELTQLPGHLAYPFSLCGIGFGMLISPLLTAKMAELFNYKWFFLIQGGLVFIKVICLLLITLLLYFYKRFGVIMECSSLLTPYSPIDRYGTLADEKTSYLSDDSIKDF